MSEYTDQNTPNEQDEEYNEWIFNEDTQEWEHPDDTMPNGATREVMDIEFRIFCNGFWGGDDFLDRTTSGNTNVNFFAEVFEKTKIKNFVFVKQLEHANVLFESVFAPSLVDYRPDWRYKIHFSGESLKRTELYFPNKSYYEHYDIVLCSHGLVRPNVIELPFFAFYSHNGNRLARLRTDMRYYKHHEYLAEKFCSYVVSWGGNPTRDRILDVVSSYKHVDSAGKHRNNMAPTTEHEAEPGLGEDVAYTSQEMIDFLGRYKFNICFENTIEGTYITEKIVNAFLARTIPIYYGSNHVKKVFNTKAFLMLEDESEEGFQKLLSQIKELDEDDTKYIEMLNEPVFNPDFDYESNYSVDAIAEKMNVLMDPPPNTYIGVNDETYPEDVRNTYILLMAYRARHPQEFRRTEMRNMIANWQEYFKKNDQDLKIVIMEQDNDKPFNKGVLWNAAFQKAEDYFEVLEPKIYIHNNSDNLINSGEPFPPDLARPEIGFMDIRRVPHLDDYIGSQMLGGCCSFDAESYKRTNGFPNNLWGWGGDDWAMMRRIRERDVPYRRSSVFNSTWMIENRDHVRDKKTNDDNIQLALTEPIGESGLNNLSYVNTGYGEFYENDVIIHDLIDF